MSKVSGFGGYWVVPSGNANAIQHNAEYDLEVEAITKDVQTSGNMGWIEGAPRACKFTSGTMKVPEDDAAYPEALGFYIGQFLKCVWFRRGEDAVYDAVTNTQVVDVKYGNNSKKARTIEIKLEYGQFWYFVEAPSTEGTGPYPPGSGGFPP